MNHRHHQQGSTLLVALVMLVVLTLMVVSAMRSSNINLRVIGNMKMQQEVSSAAQQGIEVVMSGDFTVAPAASAVQVDVNADGSADYAVDVSKPTCLGTRPLLNLDAYIPEECLASAVAQNTGLFFASGAQATSTAWCHAQQWEITATVQDSNTGANATNHQGVSMNVPAGTEC